MDIEKTIREYLPEVIHMSLATSVDNKPWVCEVHFSWDDELNLYFRSHHESRHSQEIEANPHVAGNIVTQHVAGQKPRGVYYEGVAEVVSDFDENSPAYKAISERHGVGPEMLTDSKTTYKITVSDWYVFDARESSPSQKYHLAWKK